MSELIVPNRMLIEDDASYCCSSRVGVTCKSGSGELLSFVMDPNESAYTVVLTNGEMLPGLSMVYGHVFIERYMKWAGIDQYQVWRWHVDSYPPAVLPPMLYGRYPDTAWRGDRIYRSSFEALGGPVLADPIELGMMFAACSVPTAACLLDLVPEREVYRRNAEVLWHPGVYDPKLGILVEYEDILVTEKPAKQEWVM